MNIWHIAFWIYYGVGCAAMIAIAFTICRAEVAKDKKRAIKKAHRGS